VGSLSAGNGVGGPQGNFEIYTYTDANVTPLISLRSRYDGAGKYGMIRFGDASQTTNYQKGAIIYESTTSVGRGKFHIALENTDGPGSVALADARVTVLSDGNVGIGAMAPVEKLEVNGNLKVKDAVLSPVGSAPIYGCRAWVSFDGTRNAAGVVDSAGSGTARFIRASGNVSSVIRFATGGYLITFITPMPDENYACTILAAGSHQYPFVNTSDPVRYMTGGAPSANAVRVGVASGTASVDSAYVYVTVFR
jgi:hypothetical protein